LAGLLSRSLAVLAVGWSLLAADSAVSRELGAGGHVSANLGTPQRNVRIADQFAGTDLGSKINAADKDLGSSPGEIRVTTAAIISTPVALLPNRTLVLLAPAVSC
jgi:hypothetical protein